MQEEVHEHHNNGIGFEDDDDEAIGTTIVTPPEIKDYPVKLTTTIEFQKDAESGHKMLGEFVIEGEIGDGSFSRVKKMKSKVDGKEYALKIYNKVFLESQRKMDYETMQWSNLLERIERELKVWIRLDHPNVVKLYEVFEEEGKQFLYLRIEIGDLGQVSDFDPKERSIHLNKKMLELYKKQGKEDLDEIVWTIFKQMVEGLDYIHSIGFAHRDVKLENLVINKDLKVMWIDFNSSKSFTPETTYFEYEGTHHYAPPECIFIPEPGYDPKKADIWSLGVCLYGLVYGCLPYDLPFDPTGSEPCYEMDLNNKIINTDYEIDSKSPECLKDLLKNMLNKDATKRFSMADIRNSAYFKQGPPKHQEPAMAAK